MEKPTFAEFVAGIPEAARDQAKDHENRPDDGTLYAREYIEYLLDAIDSNVSREDWRSVLLAVVTSASTRLPAMTSKRGS
jgi:hypothetical protein